MKSIFLPLNTSYHMSSIYYTAWNISFFFCSQSLLLLSNTRLQQRNNLECMRRTISFPLYWTQVQLFFSYFHRYSYTIYIHNMKLYYSFMFEHTQCIFSCQCPTYTLPSCNNRGVRLWTRMYAPSIKTFIISYFFTWLDLFMTSISFLYIYMGTFSIALISVSMDGPQENH